MIAFTKSVRFLSILLAVPLAVSAADSYWTGGNNSFNSPSAWIGGVPGGSDSANWTANVDQVTITFSADVLNANAYFNRTGDNFSGFAMGARTWTLTNQFIVAQNPGSSEIVEIDSGTLVVTNDAGTAVLLAGSSSSTGKFYLNGGTVYADRFISTNNTGAEEFRMYSGTLNILRGSTIRSSSIVELGFSNGGTSTLNYLGGANTIALGGALYIATFPNSTVSVNVGGPGTTLAVSNSIFLGYDSGQGAYLSVSNGAQLSVTGPLNNGWVSAGRIVVTGSNSVLTSANDTRLGSFGVVGNLNNSILVSNGGTFRASGAFRVGWGPEDGGQVTVTGTGSLLDDSTGTIYVGSNAVTQGKGNLLVTQNGTVEFNTLVSGHNNSGTITNSGGVFQFATVSPTITTNTANSIVVTNGTISYRDVTAADINNANVARMTFLGNNTFRLKNATNSAIASYTFQPDTAPTYAHLTLDNGRFQAATLTIADGSSLKGNGVVASANTTNLGIIAPGFSAGQLTFTNNLVLGSTSQLQMEIGGTNSVDYDRLVVGGNVTISGLLSLAPINGFSTTPGDTFTIIDNQGANLVSGEFDGLTNNAFIDASLAGMDAFFRIQYNVGTGGNDVVLIATIPEPSTIALLTVMGILTVVLRKR